MDIVEKPQQSHEACVPNAEDRGSLLSTFQLASEGEKNEANSDRFVIRPLIYGLGTYHAFSQHDKKGITSYSNCLLSPITRSY